MAKPGAEKRRMTALREKQAKQADKTVKQFMKTNKKIRKTVRENDNSKQKNKK